MGVIRNCLFALAVSPVLVASPAASSVYAGEYFYNFENAYFTAEGYQTCWDLIGDMSKAELKLAQGSQHWGITTVVLRGVLGPAGHFGNMGACDHQLTVLKILKIIEKKGR
jgi:hypothetical protein